jgi:repressor of nif and glnA expression
MPKEKLTKLTKKVLNAVNQSDLPLRPVDLQTILGKEMKIRSIRYALQILEEQKLVYRQPDLMDLRSFYISHR